MGPPSLHRETTTQPKTQKKHRKETKHKYTKHSGAICSFSMSLCALFVSVLFLFCCLPVSFLLFACFFVVFCFFVASILFLHEHVFVLLCLSVLFFFYHDFSDSHPNAGL